MSKLHKKQANTLQGQDAIVITPQQMAQIDQYAARSQNIPTFKLMQAAGQRIVEQLRHNFAQARRIAVLCGPGNNGGDGYMAAQILTNPILNDPDQTTEQLSNADYYCVCFADHLPLGGDAAQAFATWQGQTLGFDAFTPDDWDLVIDGLFGAGLSRDIDATIEPLIARLNASSTPVLAIDLPSGIDGATGAVRGCAVQADVSVTFYRLKPGHILYPGRAYCGKVYCADIGIDDSALTLFDDYFYQNIPALWQHALPQPDWRSHKYSRGAVGVFSGPASMTGAARMAAKAALRSGAGAATVICDPSALHVNAAHLTAIMVAQLDDESQLPHFIKSRKMRSLILGPGFGDLQKAQHFIQTIVEHNLVDTLVLDADALTAMAQDPNTFFASIKASQTTCILTPHEGEFARLFPELVKLPTRIERAQQAARQSHCFVLYKGADSLIASPDGRLAINTNGTPLLATAGSGDVLAGIIGGLSAQLMPHFEACCAAVWLHAQTAKHFGPGVIAEDLIEILPAILKDFYKFDTAE